MNEKSIQVLTEENLAEIAGGMSKKGKKIAKYVAAGTGLFLAGVGIGAGATVLGKYFYDNHKKNRIGDIYPDDPKIAGYNKGDLFYYGGNFHEVEEVAPRD